MALLRLLAQLLDDTVEAVLQPVGDGGVGGAHHVGGEGEERAHVLERHLVALHRLEGLRAAEEGLDVIGADLEDGGAVGDDAVKVGELLVAGGAVGEDLERDLRRRVRHLVQRLAVLRDGLRVGGWVGRVGLRWVVWVGLGHTVDSAAYGSAPNLRQRPTTPTRTSSNLACL
jgi:hypothetical protein